MSGKIYLLGASEEEIEKLMSENPDREVITDVLEIRLEEGVEFYSSTGYVEIKKNGKTLVKEGWFNDDNSYDWWAEKAFIEVLKVLAEFGGESFKVALKEFVEGVRLD